MPIGRAAHLDFGLVCKRGGDFSTHRGRAQRNERKNDDFAACASFAAVDGHAYLDPVLLSRIQFAFVVSFHIIFPAVTIGAAAWLGDPRRGRGWRPLSARVRLLAQSVRALVSAWALTRGEGHVRPLIPAHVKETRLEIQVAEPYAAEAALLKVGFE